MKQGDLIINHTVLGHFTVKEVRGNAVHCENGAVFTAVNCRVLKTKEELEKEPSKVSNKTQELYTEKQHLRWMFDRLAGVHGENPMYDYMVKFKKIIDDYENK
tara:strand:+ start:3032 stop:3340 length:309 start_codon:yes stop_codon:yes gene_type:complete